MKRVGFTTIGTVLQSYFDEMGLGDRFQEQKILDNFNTIVGPFICKYVNKMYISNRVLYLYVSNSILRGEIVMNKASMLEKLNNSVDANKKTIDDIIVR